jgi:hypothetical protein
MVEVVEAGATASRMTRKLSADLANRLGACKANAFAMVSALTRVWAPAIVIGKL